LEGIIISSQHSLEFYIVLLGQEECTPMLKCQHSTPRHFTFKEDLRATLEEKQFLLSLCLGITTGFLLVVDALCGCDRQCC
ncbi:hypothetical protein, partial [Microcystis aeruginosa]|uniref:hypothetical protein n=1 Tax=Microcystis aeruginosa TaxID=1126 RepID=UPI001C402FDC